MIADRLQRAVGQKHVGIGWLHLDGAGCQYMHRAPYGSVKHELTQLSFYPQMAQHA